MRISTGARLVAAVAAAALVTSGCGSDDGGSAAAGKSGGQDKTVRVAVLEGTQALPLALIKDGLDKKYGFTLQEQTYASVDAVYNDAKQGGFQLGFGAWPTVAALNQQGFKVSNVFPLSAATTGVLVKKDSPIKSFADLKGKTVGLFGGPAAGTTVLMQLVLKKYGITAPKDVKFRFGAAGLLGAQIQRGQIDAVLVLDPVLEKLLAGGDLRMLGDPSTIFAEQYGYVPMQITAMANTEWAKDNPDTLKAFLGAYHEAKQQMLSDDQVWPKLAAKVGIKGDGVATFRDRIRKLLVTDWNQKVIDDSNKYLKLVEGTLGGVTGFPKSLPDGSFDLSYGPQSS